MDSKRFAKSSSQKKSKSIIYVILAVVIALSAVTIFAVANIPKEVTILDGTTSRRVTTNETDPQKIISQNGFELGEYDVLDTSQFGKENSVLIIKREMTVTFSDGKDAWKVTLPARTVNDVLEYLSIELEENDEVVPAAFEVLRDGGKVTLYRAGTAVLKVDGRELSVSTSNKTVMQILAENEIVLGKDDVVEPSLDSVAADGDEITVLRVSYKELTKKEKVEYKTVEKKDFSLAKGTRKVVTEGKIGEKEVTYKIRYENGKEAGKKVLSQKILKKAVDEVVLVGTAVSSAASKGATKLVVDEKELKYTAKYTGIASAYYEPAGSLTASGMTVGVGRIGVNPNIIPYGTKLYVTGYGYCVAADCGWGTIGMGRIADLYMNSEAECEAWGVRTVTMYVLA